MSRPSRRGAVDTSKLVVGTIMVVVLLATLSWLESRFGQSDHRKARELVATYAPAGGQSIASAILARHPGVREPEISWSSEVRQSCLGHVRVSAYVPTTQTAPAQTYSFDVNLSGPSVHPTDPTTVEILRSLTSTVPATSRTSTHSTTQD